MKGNFGNGTAATGAASSLIRWSTILSLPFGLGMPGTSAASADLQMAPRTIDSTDSNVAGRIAFLAPPSAESPAQSVLEIRRITGMTWDDLGTLFGVTRRSVHHWASGKPVNAKNEHRIRKTLHTFRSLDRGSVSSTRTLVFAPNTAGMSIFDLLQTECYEIALDRVRELPAARRAPPAVLSPEETRRRRPPPLDEMLGAESPGDLVSGKAITGRFKRLRQQKG